VVGQRRLVVALGGDRNEICGARQQVHQARRLRAAAPAGLSPGSGCRAYRGPP
jgi:hypothetical protein